MELKIGGKYRTRGGKAVIIVKKDSPDNYPWTVAFCSDNQPAYSVTNLGKVWYSAETDGDDLVSEEGDGSPEPAPFTMDARATMAMHFMAQMRGQLQYAFMADCAVEAADALIAVLTRGRRND